MVKEFVKTFVAVAGASALMTGASIGVKKAVVKKKNKKQEAKATTDTEVEASEKEVAGEIDQSTKGVTEPVTIKAEPDPEVKVPKFSVIRE